MNLIKELRSEEKKLILYLLLGIFIFLFFDYSIASFFHNINDQTKSLFETLTHFGDSLYFFIPTLLVYGIIKLIKSKNTICFVYFIFRFFEPPVA